MFGGPVLGRCVEWKIDDTRNIATGELSVDLGRLFQFVSVGKAAGGVVEFIQSDESRPDDKIRVKLGATFESQEYLEYINVCENIDQRAMFAKDADGNYIPRSKGIAITVRRPVLSNLPPALIDLSEVCAVSSSGQRISDHPGPTAQVGFRSRFIKAQDFDKQLHHFSQSLRSFEGPRIRDGCRQYSGGNICRGA